MAMELLRVRSGLGGLISGGAAVFWGLKHVWDDQSLRRLAIVPLIVTSMFYTALVFAASYFGSDLLGLVWSRPDEGILRVLWYVLVPFVVISLLVPFVLLFSTIAEAIGGPFYDKMAMRILTEHRIPTKQPGFFRGTIPDIIRSLGFALVAALCALIGLIPAFGLPFVFLGTAIMWIGLAAAAFNPALMATGLGVGARLGYVLRAFPTMLSMGAVIWASLFLPFVGLISLPSAVVGASEIYARTKKV